MFLSPPVGCGTVKDLIAGSGIELVGRGTHEFKGRPGILHLYAVW